MNKGIHPEKFEVDTHCACGSSIKTTSTVSTIKTTLCSACHPFFTGKQKFVDTAGRIEKFKSRYKKFDDKKKPAAKKKAKAKTEKK